MKKLLALLSVMMLTVYLLPLFTVSRGQGEQLSPGDAALLSTPVESSRPALAPGQSKLSPSGFSSYDDSITVSVCISDEVYEMSLKNYLQGVVAAEMPASFPEEALKAQAVAARTVCLYQLMLYEQGMEIPESHHGAQFCADHTHCQAYLNEAERKEQLFGNNAATYEQLVASCISSTDGVIAVYDGQPIAAVFHSAAAGRTEAAVDVWGYDYPYLTGVESTGGESSPRFYGTVELKSVDFKTLVSEHLPEADLSTPANEWFKNSFRSSAGGIKTVELGGVTVSGQWIRELVGLNSTNFRYQVQGDKVVFTTQGTGHGVGMSQYGARDMALRGATYDEIIKWYYTGVSLTQKS